MKRKNIFVLTMLTAASLAFSGCSGKNAAPVSVEVEKAITVNVAKAERNTIESFVTLNGKVEPISEVAIVPKASGRIVGIFYEVGQEVKAGDRLFTIDDESARLQLKQSEVALMTARTNLDNLKNGTSEQQLAQLKASVVTAELNYSNAKATYERTKELYEAGAATKDNLEKIESQYKTAEEQYNLAKTNLELTQTKLLPGNIAATEAQVKQAEVAYELAELQLKNTVVTSPVNGIVAARNVDLGDMAAAGVAAMTVVDISKVTVNVNVTEEIVNNISTVDPVEVLIAACSDTPFTGKIISIAPSVNPQSKGYPIKVEIENNDGRIKGGMFAEIRLMVSKSENSLSVPIDALLDDRGEKVVFVVEGDRVKKKKISVGLSNDKAVEILDGLAENEAVVIKGQNLLEDGDKVVVTDN